MSLLLEKKINKFLISEILMLIVNVIFYQLCSIKFDAIISSIIALLISLFFDYFLCYKYVFKDELKDNKYRIIKFCFWGICSFGIKHFVIKNMYYNFFVPLFLAKGLGFIVIVLFNYFAKYSVFQNNYKMCFDKIKEVYEIINDLWKKFISLKYIKYFFKFLPQNLFVFIFFIGSIYYSLLFIRDNNDLVLYKQEVADDIIGEFINDDIEIEFDNVDVDSSVNNICLVFGTYNRENDSNLIFKLYASDRRVFQKKINTNILVDGQGYCLDIPSIKKADIKQYKLKVISENANAENNVTLFRNKETKEITLYLKNSRGLFSLKNFAMILYIIIFIIINFYINNKGDRLKVNNFLLLMLVYILSILFIYPPLENPDEPSHMHSSYNLSQNLFKADETMEIVVPENIDCLNYSRIQYLDRVTNLEDVAYCLEQSVTNKTVNNLFGSGNKVTYSVLGHAPQALSIGIADKFSDSPLFIFYFARLGNFILAFSILYFAIKMAPKGKNILLFVGVLPMFVQQITSLSYDALLNSLALLYTAYIIKKYNQKDKIVMKDIIVPTIFLLVSITVKVVYVPIAILLLFIPQDKFKNFKQYLVFVACIIGVVLIGNYVIKDILFVAESAVDVRFDNQLNYLLKNPLDIISIGINTLVRNSVFYLRGIVGYFGWFRFRLSDFTVIMCLVLFGILAFSENEIIKFSKKKESSKLNYKKIMVIISVLISIGAIFLSMYLCWSEYKLPYVDGVQGRYFMPILAIIVLLFVPKVKKIKFRQVDLYSFINILLLQYVIYTITFFY